MVVGTFPEDGTNTIKRSVEKWTLHKFSGPVDRSHVRLKIVSLLLKPFCVVVRSEYVYVCVCGVCCMCMCVVCMYLCIQCVCICMQWERMCV